MARREAALGDHALAVLMAGLVTLALFLLTGLPEARPGGLASRHTGSGLVLAAGPRAAATVADAGRRLPRAALVTVAEADDPAGEPRAAAPACVPVPQRRAAACIRPAADGPLPAPAGRLPERPPRLA
ncbi:hypothetical protein [Methylobacterium trifolii]|uniref:Uncharacterized protein n=1 Tax=Methylobacterium trifolii TaxID=1003092 RepID=A0ABQ4U0Q9_9HYPH|nr:hypothetical protein [Methylobacterium trifolii]GJE61036.1 hypothetical protein MPOCJGCO_3157 [Methylobacterium trifolii]